MWMLWSEKRSFSRSASHSRVGVPYGTPDSTTNFIGDLRSPEKFGTFSVVKDGAVGGKLSCRENSGERSSVRDPIGVSTLVELFGVKRTEPPLVVRNVF